jgi:hypothetical protein
MGRVTVMGGPLGSAVYPPGGVGDRLRGMKVHYLPSRVVYPDLSKVRFMFGIHFDNDPPLGPVIEWVSRQVLSPPYVLSGGPATHAFMCLDYAGVRWRLDGKPPVSAWSPWWSYADESQVALWEVIPEAVGEDAFRRGLDKAAMSHGVLYDVPLLVAQLLALAPNGIQLPPGLVDLAKHVPLPKSLRLPPLPGMGLPGVELDLPDPPHADICTTLDMDVGWAMGAPLAGYVDGMPDRFPERFGRVMETAVRGGLLRRRMDVNKVA